MMNIKEIEQELKSGLNKLFKYEICHKSNLTGPVLIILDYSPQNESPPASFALSLEQYEEGTFPFKCWMTHTDIVPVTNAQYPPPKPYSEYGTFSHNGLDFNPFSVNLSGYTPKEASSIRCLIGNLYRHIRF